MASTRPLSERLAKAVERNGHSLRLAYANTWQAVVDYRRNPDHPLIGYKRLRVHNQKLDRRSDLKCYFCAQKILREIFQSCCRRGILPDLHVSLDSSDRDVQSLATRIPYSGSVAG